MGRHDSASLFDWLVGVFQYQGVSDTAASRFIETHGAASFADLTSVLSKSCSCTKLRCYWSFADCSYRRMAQTCAEPELMGSCPLPVHPFRNGRLSQSAYSLFLFIRDVCDGDLVGWIDKRLEEADDGGASRAVAMRDALLEPLGNIFGVSNKVLSMAFADLLLGADPDRERWVTAGASMIAVDTLVHNFLHRTGILHGHGRPHAYGPACYGLGGCAAVIEELAAQIDARRYGEGYPQNFPRFVQHAIWSFCAQSGWNICNGNRIDDRDRCQNAFCPVSSRCQRVALGQT
ncbi:MAG: hypothetical protein AB7I79_15185 [Rhizobiaceae bacterium]